MTKREIVTQALEHRQCSKIPYQIGFTYKVRQQMAEYYNDPEFEKKLGNHLYSVSWTERGIMQRS